MAKKKRHFFSVVEEMIQHPEYKLVADEDDFKESDKMPYIIWDATKK